MSRKLVLVVLLVCLSIVFVAGNGYNSEGDASEKEADAPVPREIDPRIVRQMPYVKAVKQIRELQEAEGLEGFTGLRLVEDRELTLYWKGKLPPSVESLLRTLQEEITVRVVKRLHSQTELRAETKRIAESFRQLQAQGITITEVGPLPDSSGIRVGIEVLPGQDFEEEAQKARAIIQSPIPLQFTVGSELDLFNGR